MGTKANPSKYDCYAEAADDEPLFILRAKDPTAAILVRLWADMQGWKQGGDSYKTLEAKECADQMDKWRLEHT